MMLELSLCLSCCLSFFFSAHAATGWIVSAPGKLSPLGWSQLSSGEWDASFLIQGLGLAASRFSCYSRIHLQNHCSVMCPRWFYSLARKQVGPVWHHLRRPPCASRRSLGRGKCTFVVFLHCPHTHMYLRRGTEMHAAGIKTCVLFWINNSMGLKILLFAEVKRKLFIRLLNSLVY